MGPIKAGCLTVLAGAVAVIATIYVLHQQSFCFDEWRFTSDEEKVNAAAFEGYQWNNGFSKSAAEVRPIPYSSFEEFRELNGRCCSLVTEETRSGPDRFELTRPGFTEILTGSKVEEVIVRYAERYLNEDGTQRVETKLRVMPVSACAQVIID